LQKLPKDGKAGYLCLIFCSGIKHWLRKLVWGVSPLKGIDVQAALSW
jgi:hypothetical protein